MSSASESPDPHNAEYLHGSDHANVDLPHATLRGYLTGFGLSVILTIVPFWIVMGHVVSDKNATSLLVLAFGAVQIVVRIV